MAPPGLSVPQARQLQVEARVRQPPLLRMREQEAALLHRAVMALRP